MLLDGSGYITLWPGLPDALLAGLPALADSGAETIALVARRIEQAELAHANKYGIREEIVEKLNRAAAAESGALGAALDELARYIKAAA